MNQPPLDSRACAELFELPANQCYLLAHSLGALPKQTRTALQSGMLDIWGHDPQEAWPRWIQALDQFREALARFLGGQAEQYCPQVNVSSGFAKALGAAWPNKKTRTLLLSEADFPSLGFVAQCAQRLGWTLEWIPDSLNQCEFSVWEHALHPGIDAVLVTHVQYGTNRRTPIAQISQLAKAQGALCIVDVCQSAGVVPLDLSALNADIVLGSCLKWICGGPGAGFMWIHPNPICPLEPTDVGWFSHQNPFEFDIRNFDYAQGAARFAGGTPSVLPFVSATVGLETLTDIGIEAISAHNRRLTNTLRASVSPELLLSDQDPAKRGGTTVIALSAQDPKLEKLRAQNIAFDARKFGIRLSPHLYTHQADIERVAEILSA